MGNSFNQWEDEGVNVQRSNASPSELKHLSKITSLDLHITDGNILPENLFSDKLERYHILIANAWKWHAVDETHHSKTQAHHLQSIGPRFKNVAEEI